MKKQENIIGRKKCLNPKNNPKCTKDISLKSRTGLCKSCSLYKAIPKYNKCLNPNNNPNCGSKVRYYVKSQLCKSCSLYGKKSKMLGKEYAERINFVYECCGKEKRLREAVVKFYKENNINTCKECHLVKMRKNLPKSWTPERREKTIKSLLNKEFNYSEEEKKRRSEWAKEMTKDPEVHKKKRLSCIKNIQDKFDKIGNNFYPQYSFESIPIIESYGKENGYNFQHAENGGEFYIKELGYWVDGYDIEQNVVLEYDEKWHFNKKGRQEKDQQRQQEIIEYLQCKFIRIKYDGTITIFK